MKAELFHGSNFTSFDLWEKKEISYHAVKKPPKLNKEPCYSTLSFL